MAEPTVVTPEPFTIAGIRRTIAMADIRDYYDTTFVEVGRVLGEQGAEVVGPAVGVYWGQPSETVTLAAGLPTAAPISPAGDVTPIEVRAERAAQLVHEGGYDGLGEAWPRLYSWIVEQGLEPGELMWETYLTEPTPGADPDDMRTLLTWSVTTTG